MNSDCCVMICFLQTIIEGKRRPLGPSVEKPNHSPFLTEEPFDLLVSGNYNKVPVIIGHCNGEGNLSEVLRKMDGKEPVHENFDDLVPYDLELPKGSASSKEVARKIKEFYYKDGNTNDLESFSIVS